MPSSPYVVGQWVRAERFYGRSTLIDEILHGHRNWLWLLGTRRVGKTSLLKQLEWLTSASAETGYFPLFWDFQGADDAEELHRGFSEAILDAEERLDEAGIALADVRGTTLFDSLGMLRRKLRSSGRRLLLLCDEVEELIKLHQKDPALLRKLRRAVQAQEDIRTVMASTIRLWELARQEGDTSPFLHGFTPPLHIQRLHDHEALALIGQTGLRDTARPAVDAETAETIRAHCDNHPYLVQLVSKRFLECGSLVDAIEAVATDAMVSHFFSVDFEMLSVSEREIIRIIGETNAADSNSIQDYVSIGSDELQGSLLRLESLGYVRRNDQRRFELVNFFFRRWFRQQAGAGRSSRTSGRPGVQLSHSTADTVGAKTVQPALFDGRYRLLEEVGRGATGSVYKARDEIVREVMAIKILKVEYCANPSALERVRQEILLARDIGHPNILKVYHLGHCNGQRYLTMRWIDGPTLARRVADGGPLPLPRLIDIGAKLASALEAAHVRKVLHRDIKPQNILLDEHDEPYLTDFGLARLAGAPGLTHLGMFLGTPDFASPEQARLEPADARSDIYSLGVVLFEMATGTRPFRAETLEQVLEMQRSAVPPDPRALRPDLPPALALVILRCLEKDRTRRFATAAELERALEDARPS